MISIEADEEVNWVLHLSGSSLDHVPDLFLHASSNWINLKDNLIIFTTNFTTQNKISFQPISCSTSISRSCSWICTKSEKLRKIGSKHNDAMVKLIIPRIIIPRKATGYTNDKITVISSNSQDSKSIFHHLSCHLLPVSQHKISMKLFTFHQVMWHIPEIPRVLRHCANEQHKLHETRCGSPWDQEDQRRFRHVSRCVESLIGFSLSIFRGFLFAVSSKFRFVLSDHDRGHKEQFCYESL